MNKLLLLTIIGCLSFFIVNAQCNGYTELCAKKFNEVSTVMTHNAFNNTDDGFILTNQTHTISTQLENGVRGLMLDVYNVDGVISQYHGFSTLGIEPLSEDLAEIKNFLDNNPNEIISIIFQSAVTSTDIENELDNAGLMSYLHHHTLGTEWATLQEMINDNERLVIFSESDDGLATQTWYHYAWAHVFDTDYSYSFPTDFHCGVNRGDVSNDLYLVNHWITTAVGTGDIIQAAIVNNNPLLIDRLQECEGSTGKLPNFIGVDFYELGDAFEAAETLNGITTSTENMMIEDSKVKVFPNPVTSMLQISSRNSKVLNFQLFNVLGEEIYNEPLINGNLSVSCTDYINGMYIYSITTENEEVLEKGKLLVCHK